MSPKSRIDKIENLEEIVAQATSWADLAERLGYKKSGNFIAIQKKINEAELDTSHFTGRGWSKEKNRFNSKAIAKQVKTREVPWEEAFSRGSTTRNRVLIQRLIAAGKKRYQCEICGLARWQGKPLRLQLDHIDGDNSNSLESNLRIICPNCHTQTPTFCLGKRDKTEYEHRRRWWEQLSLGAESYLYNNFDDDMQYRQCACGNNKTKKAKQCSECANKNRNGQGSGRVMPHTRKFNPTEEELKKLVWSMPATAVGEKFGVSDKAVEKRCKQLGIEKPPRGYWAKKKLSGKKKAGD